MMTQKLVDMNQQRALPDHITTTFPKIIRRKIMCRARVVHVTPTILRVNAIIKLLAGEAFLKRLFLASLAVDWRKMFFGLSNLWCVYVQDRSLTQMMFPRTSN